LEAIIALLTGILVVVLAIGAGQWFLRRFELRPSERLAYGGALGMGIVAYLVGLFTALYLLNGLWVVLMLVALAGVWGWIRVLPLLRGAPSQRTPPPTLGMSALAGLIALLTLVLCLLPPDGNEWDTLAYHFAFPKLYLKAGGMIEIPFMHQSYFPPLLDMLFLLGLWLGSEPMAKVFHWAMGILTALGLAGFVARRGGDGVASALLWLGTPVVAWQAFTAYVDLSTALYVSLAVYALYEGITQKQARWLWLAGALMGFALATKYNALLSWGLLGLLGLLWCVRERWASGARMLVLAGILALAIGAPWYLRNWYWTGNPVYPFAYSLFGGEQWSQAQADAYRNDQLKFGMGRAPAQLLLAPWNLTAHPAPFADPIGVAIGERAYLLPASGMGYLAGLGILVGGGVGNGLGWLLGFVGLSMLGWFVLMQQVRYMLFVFPVWGAVIGARLNRLPRWQSGLFVGLLVAQGGFTLWLLGSSYLPWLGLAQSDREAFLMRRLQIYPAVRYLNTQTPNKAGVILLDETRGYYLERPYLWGNAGHHRLIPYDQLADGDALVRWLMQNGYRYVLINRMFTPQGAPETWRALYYDAIRKGSLQLVFSERQVEVYQVVGQRNQ